MRPLAARCHLALGRIARRRGDHEAAGPHLAVAEDMFREMDMRYWLDRLSLDLVSPTPPF